MENKELYHHGVIGMKWGVRRYQNKDGTLTPAGKKRYNQELEKLKQKEKVLKNKQATKAKMDKLNAMRKNIKEQEKGTGKLDVIRKKTKPSDDAHDTKQPVKKSIKDMSDDELRTAIQRIKMEQEFKTLTTPVNQARASKGKDFAMKVLERSAENLLPQVVNYAGAKALNKMLGGDKEVIFANNKKKS